MTQKEIDLRLLYLRALRDAARRGAILDYLEDVGGDPVEAIARRMERA